MYFVQNIFNMLFKCCLFTIAFLQAFKYSSCNINYLYIDENFEIIKIHMINYDIQWRLNLIPTNYHVISHISINSTKLLTYQVANNLGINLFKNILDIL